MKRSYGTTNLRLHRVSPCRRGIVHSLALLAVAWVAACGGDGGTDPEPAPQPNRAPAASGSIPAQTMLVGESVTVNVASLFSDPDGDALTFTAISSNTGVASVALSGTTVTVTAVGAGTATVTVTARDPGGLSGALSGSVTVQEPNRPPMALAPVAPSQTAVVGDTINLDVAPFFTDPDRDALTYSAESANTSRVTVSVAGSVVSAAAVGVGSTTLTVTATDPDGLSGSISVPVTVEPNLPPETTQDSLPSLSIPERDSATVNLASYFTDPNGDALTYTAASSDAGVATVAVSGATLTVTAVAIGTATVTVTAYDRADLTASLSGSVTVTERVNQAPEATGIIRPVMATVGWSGTLDLEGERPIFVDPDDDPLTYSAESSDPSVASLSVTGAELRVTLEAAGSAVATVTATDPDGLSASLSFDITVLPEAATIFRDDFNDDTSLENWEVVNAQAEVSEGILRLANASDTLWGVAGRVLDTPVTSWEVRARLGRQADTLQTALFFVLDEPGERNAEVFRLFVGSRVLDFGGGNTETVNYALQVWFEPEGRELGWYYIGGGDAVNFRGVSDAINDEPNEFTDITVSVQDGAFAALADTATLFSLPISGLSFGDALQAITEVHLWTYDSAVTASSLLDWIEVNGVPTESSSTNADRDDSFRQIPSDLIRDVGVAAEISVADPFPDAREKQLRPCATPGCR